MEPSEGKMTETSSSESVSTKQRRIAELAKQAPKMVLTTLAHHIDLEWMLEAYRRTRKDGAAGVDGQTAAEYERALQDNLRSLLDRFKSGTYRAPPVRRVHIPKGDGRKTRPIGIPTFEDKVLQTAVKMVLEPVCEQDFLDCSYGFRPGRSAHQALEVIWESLMRRGGGWVLEVDIESFFDSVEHGHLRSFLDQRVRDGVVRRTIDKWLSAGVMEEGCVRHPDTGTPQGGVVSPLLANIYLHEVVDRWFGEQVLPRLRGAAVLVRYADDMVMVFEHEEDARRVEQVLPKRFGKYGLRLHPQKTRLVEVRPPASGSGQRKGAGSFVLLGFTHFWERSRKGRWVVRRKTAPDRFTRALKRVVQWCRWHRHEPVAQQGKQLSAKLRGHYQYYGVTGNAAALQRFWYEVKRGWFKWLNRRNPRATMTWEAFYALPVVRQLAPPRVVHSIYRVT
jgi:group II intron reverse transcriptase/maturase